MQGPHCLRRSQVLRHSPVPCKASLSFFKEPEKCDMDRQTQIPWDCAGANAVTVEANQKRRGGGAWLESSSLEEQSTPQAEAERGCPPVPEKTAICSQDI